MAIKILIGGSPCTYWSIAQTNNRETKAEGMGWELFKNYLIAKEKFKPDFFLYENNKSAAQAIKDQISEEFGVGVDPKVRFTYINSALVSAQNRQRFYVTNFGDIEQPEDRGILLKDILESGQPRYEKSPCVDANYYKGGNLSNLEKQSGERLQVAEPVGDTKDKAYCLTANYAGAHPEHSLSKGVRSMVAEPIYIGEVPEHNGTYRNGKQASQQYRVYDTEGKGVSVTTSAITNVAEPVRIPEYGNDDKARPLNAHYSNNCGGFEHRMFSPNPAKQQVDMIAEPINTTPEGKSQTIKAQYQNTSVANVCCYHSTYGATGVAEPVNTTSDGKAVTLKAQYYKNGTANLLNDNSKGGKYAASGVAEPIRVGSLPRPNGELSTSQAMQIYSPEGKSTTQMAGGGGLGGKTGLYAIPVNTTDDGNKSRTIMAGYYKYGTATILTNDGFKGGTTAVSEPVPVGKDEKTDLYAIQTDEPMRVSEATKQGYVDINIGDCVDLTQPNSKTRRGRSLTEKSNCLTTSNQQYEYCGVLGYATPVEWDENGVPTKAVSCADGKTYTVYCVKDGQITIKGKQYPIKLIDGYYIIRKLTVRECARLQTMPDDYCKAVSDSQAYKALGNGWTAEVIIHLLNHALKDIPRDEEIVVLSMYDGIATGRYCLDKMGFTNVTYHAYEIDKYPIMVAMDNYPDIIQHGDAFAVREDDWKPPQTRSEWLDELLRGEL